MKRMERNLGALDRDFDVLVVGGGVYGACLARAAARGGLNVALLERGDFGSGVSHNSLKIIHGGFRYIQHFDLPRIWESVAAQRGWLRAAPHLVRPLRCVIPAYGYGTRGPLAFAAGICAFHGVTIGRNAGLSGSLRLPPSGILSRRSLLSMYPELDRKDLKGGAYWYDAQMLDANRLIFECVRDAWLHGAAVANHVEVLHLLSAGPKVEGAVARDVLTGREFEVRARVTVNATGPYIESLLTGSKLSSSKRSLVWTRNVNIVTRKLFDTHDAVGVGSQRPSDAAVGASKRLFFVTSWQDRSVVGTSHVKHEGDPQDIRDEVRKDVQALLAEVNEALPNAKLDADDVLYVHSGLTPAEDDVERAKRSTVIDHEQVDGQRGLITVLGIKYTTAPTVAASVMRLIQRILKRDRQALPAAEFWRALPGAVGYTMERENDDFASTDWAWARRIYGRNAEEMRSALPPDGLSEAEHIFRCRVLYGIRNEMVMRLRDAVFRATDLAERGRLTAAQLDWCANVLADTYGWNAQRRQSEMEEVIARVRLHVAPDDERLPTPVNAHG